MKLTIHENIGNTIRAEIKEIFDIMYKYLYILPIMSISVKFPKYPDNGAHQTGTHGRHTPNVQEATNAILGHLPPHFLTKEDDRYWVFQQMSVAIIFFENRDWNPEYTLISSYDRLKNTVEESSMSDAAGCLQKFNKYYEGVLKTLPLASTLLNHLMPPAFRITNS